MSKQENTFRKLTLFSLSILLSLLLQPGSRGQVPGAERLTPNLVGQVGKALRYRPESGAFVIENGPEFFNRPLYGGRTAFRADAGDRPEFSIYLPGRGGNLRLGFKTAEGVKWFHSADSIITRYIPGEMRYEIRDKFLGEGVIVMLDVLALERTEGLIVRTEIRGQTLKTELIWGFGGSTGERGQRDGDIGTERVPIGQYFQLKPEYCQNNTFELNTDSFTLHSVAATIVGISSQGVQLGLSDALQWNAPEQLMARSSTSAPVLPVVVGRVQLAVGQFNYLLLQRISDKPILSTELNVYKEVSSERGPRAKRAPVSATLLPVFKSNDLPRLFADTQAYFGGLREHLAIDTPDPFINTAAAALNVVADAVWDDPQNALMHGAIAWRSKLLGWRGPYMLDALGWPDRAREHFAYWAARQNTEPIPSNIPPADAKENLSRSETALHSNGDISNSHYDMNLVYIDALFRHLLWTGDLEFARKVWPVIERHLAWERRLFRREFGPDKLPLYEAYAAIWASDDLQYSGGGTAHASAYNYYHNKQAARLAQLLGYDPKLYEREAELIGLAMRKYLWLPEGGTFAEFKDLLGLQLVHPSAALWTIYHTIDSEVSTQQEVWQMTKYIDAQMPHIPVMGSGVPSDQSYYVLPETSWMPYSWSINNVVMAENLHMALAYWQAGRADDGFRLMKGALLASMFMGICPGNVGAMNYLDVYRRESQRDFSDGCGMLSRALVEGLFGVKPDALAGQITIAPGFPSSWDHARLRHSQISVEFKRESGSDLYIVESRFPKPMNLHLQIQAKTESAAVKLNGLPIEWRLMDSTGMAPRIEILCQASSRSEIEISWTGSERPHNAMSIEEKETRQSVPKISSDFRRPLPSSAGMERVDLTPFFNDRVTEIFKAGKYISPRSPYASLAPPSQGIGAWAGHVNAKAEIDDSGLRAASGAHGGNLFLPNGVSFATPGPGSSPNIIFTSQWKNYPPAATIPLTGRAGHAYLLMAGSTNWMQSRFDNGEIIITYADGTGARLALQNPTTWWPIDQDYFIDDYQFRYLAPLPPRVDLRTGSVRLPTLPEFKGKGRTIPGGAATVLDLPLDLSKELRSLTVRALANEVVIGLMSLTLERENKG